MSKQTKPTCDDCVHFIACQAWTSGCLKFTLAEHCSNYAKPFEPTDKICPFERQNRHIGGALCIGQNCAWWDGDHCVVFRHFDEKGVEKEIQTVFGGDDNV